VQEFGKRLSSRKFLLTIAGIVLVQLFPEQQGPIIILVGTFVGAEGIRDVVQSYVNASTQVAAAKKDIALIETGDYQVDSGPKKIVPGQS
jgi:hypothetical protein